MASQTTGRACLLYVPVLLVVVQLSAKASAQVSCPVSQLSKVLEYVRFDFQVSLWLHGLKVTASSSSLLMAAIPMEGLFSFS